MSAVAERTSGADAVLPLLRAVRIHSPTSAEVGGEPVAPMPGAPADGSAMVQALLEALYRRAYARRLHWPASPAAADEDLTPALSAANPGRERWEPGWMVTQALGTGRVLAERYGQARLLWPGEFIASDAPGAPPRAGVGVTLWRPRESATLQPGFYFAFGEAGWDDEAPVLRVYWNVTPEGAPALTAAVAGTLNRWGVPFRYKVLNRRAAYPRTDSAVLYVACRAWPLVSELVAGVHAGVHPVLEPDAPPFARPLARGMALAEDPGNGDSFGMHRCRLVAEGLWAAWSAGRTGTRERLAAVRDAFARAGVDLDRPWQSAGPADRYPEAGDA